MPKLRRVEFRVHKSDYERIVNNARAKGFCTLSKYLRSLALEKDFFIEKTVIDTNRKVTEILQKIEKKTPK